MKNIFYNTGYFLKETITIIRLNLISNLFTLLSTGLILFILSLVISGWWVSNQTVSAIKDEAEISIYYQESLDNNGVMQIAESLKTISGVQSVLLIDEKEAYSRMEGILGKEAKVLEYFDDNPFTSFIEAKVDLEKLDSVLWKIKLIPGVEYIRDNKEVLNRIENIAGVLKLLGILIIIAVGISTLVIVGHIIRLGVYNNREQINTLRLLGANELFIALPFLLLGLFLTLGGGILASALTVATLKYGYAQISGPLPFIPLPPLEVLDSGIRGIVMSLSLLLGIAGSLFGLSSAEK